MKEKHKNKKPPGNTLDTYFKKPLHQPHPERLHSHRNTKESFIRNLMDASIVGRRPVDPLARTAWRMDMMAHRPEVMAVFLNDAVHDLCFWGDSGTIAIGCESGVRTEHIDAHNNSRDVYLTEFSASFVRPLNKDRLACAARDTNGVRILSAYHHHYVDLGIQCPPVISSHSPFPLSSPGFNDLAVVSETSVLAARRIRQILEWDLRSSPNPHRAYQFSGRQEDTELSDGFLSIQSIQSEHIIVAAARFGEIGFWDVRNQRCSVIYPFLKQRLCTPPSSSGKDYLDVLSMRQHPEDPTKLAFLGRTAAGMAVGLLEMRTLAISHLKCIAPNDLEERRHALLPYKMAWMPRSNTIVCGNDREELCFVHFGGKPDTRIRSDENALRVVKIPTEGQIFGADHHVALDATVCGALPQTVLRINNQGPLLPRSIDSPAEPAVAND